MGTISWAITTVGWRQLPWFGVSSKEKETAWAGKHVQLDANYVINMLQAAEIFPYISKSTEAAAAPPGKGELNHPPQPTLTKACHYKNNIIV